MVATMMFKILLTSAYILIVICVPNLPSYYNFIITSLAYMITTLVFCLMVEFLNNQQKTLLNRLLIIFLSTGMLATTRCYAVCFTSCWFHSAFENFVNHHQTLSTIILPLNSYSVIVSGSFLLMCAGRLLLYVSPSLYHRVNPSFGSYFSGIVLPLICILDSYYNWFKCGSYEDHTNLRLLILLRGELGFPQDTNPCNKTASGWAHDEECTFFPTIQILLISALVLEFLKVCVSTWKEVKKQRRKSKVLPAKPHTEMKCRRVLPTRKFQHSESYPKISQSKINGTVRRTSISEPTSITLANLADTAVTSQIQPSSKVQMKTGTAKIVARSIHKTCMRSSTILTVFALVCAISATVNALNSTPKSTCWVYSDKLNSSNKAIRRLIYFCFSVCIFFFDKEFFMFFCEKFNFI